MMIWLAVGSLPLWAAALAFYRWRGESPDHATYSFPRHLSWPGYALFGYLALNMFFLIWFLRAGYTAIYDNEYFLVSGRLPPEPISRAQYLYYESFKARFLSAWGMAAYYAILVHVWCLEKGLAKENLRSSATS